VRGAWQDSTEKASRRARSATDPEKARGVWAADNICRASRKGGMAMGRDQGGGKGVMG